MVGIPSTASRFCRGPLAVADRCHAQYRILRFHVHHQLHALLPWAARFIRPDLDCVGIHALWTVFRFHGW